MKKLLFLLSFLLILSGCEKDQEPANNGNNNPGGTTPLSIISINPVSAEAGAKVVITGTGFSTVAAENIIKFGSLTAVTDSASPTRLVTKVPAGAVTGKISVETGGKSATSSSDITIVTNPAPATGNDGRLFLSSGTFISCVDAAQKKTVWQYNTGNKTVPATIRIDKQTLYASLVHNSGKEAPEIIALNVETGTKKWGYSLSGALNMGLTDVYISGSVITFCSREPYNNKSFTVHALSATDGKLKWSKKLNADNFYASKYIKTIGNQIFVAHADGVTSFNNESGSAIWESASQKIYPREGNIQVLDDAVLVIGDDQLITCLDAATGKIRWRSADKYYYINGMITYDKKVIAPNEATNKINLLNISDGKVAREINLPAESFYDRVFINEGKLHRINLSGGGISTADLSNGAISVLGPGKVPGSSILRTNAFLYEFSGAWITANTISNNTWTPSGGFSIELDKIYAVWAWPPRITYVTKNGQVIYPISLISSY